MAARNPFFDSDDPAIYDVPTRAPGPSGSLPLTEHILRTWPSGDLFGWSMNAGMGWAPEALGGKEFLILSTHGGLRAPDGTPIALGYHTGHWEVGLLVEAAARELKSAGAIPFAGACTDPCDGRSQGTTAMFDSLPYRNDAATIFRRLIRSLPRRSGVIGVATCDKGLPAMMMALASMHDLPCVLVPGGTTLLPEKGEDAGTIQSAGARFSHGQITLEEVAELGCRACASPGGGCQFLGTAATSQVIGEALGMSLGHAALAPSGHAIWLDMARRSARAAIALESRGIHTRGVRRIDKLDPAPAGGRARRRSPAADGRRLVAHQPKSPSPCRRPAEWSAKSSHGASLSRRRRAGSDVASSPRGIARDARAHRGGNHVGRATRRVGGVGPPRKTAGVAARTRRRRSRRCDLVAGRSRSARNPLDGVLPPRKSRARGIGDQEHVDRSVGGERRRRVSQARTGESLPHRTVCDRGDQGKAHSSGRYSGVDLPRTDGCGHGRDVSAYFGAKIPGIRQACRAAHRRAFLRRVDRSMHRPHFAGSAGRRTNRQTSRRRCDRH